MHIKHGFRGCLLIGGAAGILRIIEYLFTIDQSGYYLNGHGASLLSGILTGLLLSGFLWSLFCGISFKKSQEREKNIFGNEEALLPYFNVVGIVTIVIGIIRLFGSASFSALDGIISILGGIGWCLAGNPRKRVWAAALLPTFHMGARIIIYFAQTYKYIHISGHILETLALCSQALLTLLVMKRLVGADASRERLVRAAFWVVLLTPAASIAPLITLFKGLITAETLFSALSASAYLLLSIRLLRSICWAIDHPEPEEEPKEDDYPEIPLMDEDFQ